MDASRGSKIAEDVLRVVAGTAIDKIARLPVEQQRQKPSQWKFPTMPYARGAAPFSGLNFIASKYPCPRARGGAGFLAAQF